MYLLLFQVLNLTNFSGLIKRDLIPKDLSDLRLIFAKEPTQISKEEMEQILDILNQYFPEE